MKRGLALPFLVVLYGLAACAGDDALDPIVDKPIVPEKIVHPVAVDDSNFGQAAKGDWVLAFHEPGIAGDWQDNWFMDGANGNVNYTPKGMEVKAGTQTNDNGHIVLWSRQWFEGDVIVTFDWERLDNLSRNVTILYIQSTGSGELGYEKDLLQWRDKRTPARMSIYNNNTNTFHISYSTDNYIRLRRIDPTVDFLDSVVPSDKNPVDLWQTGEPHKVTVIKRDNRVYMRVVNSKRTATFEWDATDRNPITEGRLGLRHMYRKNSRYKDIKVYEFVQ